VVSTDEVNSSTFEIDLSMYQLRYGDNVTIQIRHKDDCVPKIINPEALRSKPTFETVSISMNADGVISWSTRNEQAPLTFIIEQFRWNKWVYAGEVLGAGTPELHTYSFKATLHSGENKFRVKQMGYVNSATRYTPSVAAVSSLPVCQFSASKKSDRIVFSCSTLYEVYDFYGNIVKKGYGTEIDMSNLSKAGYYLCYDNQVSELRKK
jgi:hypothetical protein